MNSTIREGWQSIWAAGTKRPWTGSLQDLFLTVLEAGMSKTFCQVRAGSVCSHTLLPVTSPRGRSLSGVTDPVVRAPPPWPHPPQKVLSADNIAGRG